MPKVTPTLSHLENKDHYNTLSHHITQSWQWGEFRSKTPSVKKVIRMGNSKRAFQITIHKLPKVSFTIAYLPRSPLPTPGELREIVAVCKAERALFLQIEPDFTKTNPLTLPGAQEVIPLLPRHTIVIDLTKSEEELLKQMHEKTRYNVRLATKKGVIVKEESSKEAVEKFVILLEASEARQGFYAHSRNYYTTLWDTLRPAHQVYLLNAYIPENKDKPIAGAMLLKFKNTIYYAYAGFDMSFRSYMAPQLLYFATMRLGKKLDCEIFDLWSSYKETPSESDPWWGVYRVKQGFGGEEIHYPVTIDIPLSPLYPLFVMGNALRWQLLKLKRMIHI